MTTTIAKGVFRETQIENVSSKKLLTAAPLAGILAAALNTVVYFIYKAIGFNIMLPLPNPADPTQLTSPLSLTIVVALSFIAALAAGALLWVLNRYTTRPLTLFTIISAVVLVLSFGLSLPLDMAASFKLGLDGMHVVAAFVIVSVLTRRTRAA